MRPILQWPQEKLGQEKTVPTIFLTHIPHMLKNYYGERALAELRKLGDVRLNDTGRVLGAKALAQAAQGCEIIISDRQTAGPAEFFPLVGDLVAFLRVAVDIRNVDVAAASAQGILVTHATPGFIASVDRDGHWLHDRLRAPRDRGHICLPHRPYPRSAYGPPA